MRTLDLTALLKGELLSPEARPQLETLFPSPFVPSPETQAKGSK